MTGRHSVDSVTAGTGEAYLGLGSARQQNLYACSLLLAQAVYTSSCLHRQLCVPKMPDTQLQLQLQLQLQFQLQYSYSYSTVTVTVTTRMIHLV